MDFERDLMEQNQYQQQALGQFKKLNKLCQVLRRKEKDIVVFPSSSQGSNIKNAETGEFTRSIVGSMDEDLFYKVTIATGEFESGPLTLFYNSPTHYERHHGEVVSDDAKFRWRLKQQQREDYLQQRKEN
jgi:hypothetical protein